MSVAANPRHSAGVALALLPLAGLLFWFAIGLTWGPHNESFDWIVRLDTLSFGQVLVARLPSVLSQRPLGAGLAWAAYRISGHDVALAQWFNAALALFAWWWLGRAVPQRRSFALAALVAGGIFFAGYIWVFHLHGIFYGPLLLFVAWLVHASRGPLGAGALLRVLAGAALAALAHPYALPLAVALALGALLERRELRTGRGPASVAAVLVGAAVLYLCLVPGDNRGVAEHPLQGWIVSFRTIELNLVVSVFACAMAAWVAGAMAQGRARLPAMLVVFLAGLLLARAGCPALVLWLALALLQCVRRGHWALAALLAVCVALPAANPTGSPTYAIFAIFVATAVTAMDPIAEPALGWLGEPVAAALLAAALVLGLVVRSGVEVPVLSRLASPLLAERERTRQFTQLIDELLDSAWRDHPMRLLRDAENPTQSDATERRFRPPTNDHHFQTWLAHRRGESAVVGDTLVIAFGGERVPGEEVVLAAHGRYCGDALVFRRPAAIATTN